MTERDTSSIARPARIAARGSLQRVRQRLIVVVAAACVVAIMPELARAQSDPTRTEIHGFGTWAYGRTDFNSYQAGLPDGDYRSSEFSLNLSHAINDRMRVVGQLFFVESAEGPESEIDYAFAEWRVSDKLKLRIGEVKLPFGISTELFDVGTLRPFVRLPQAIYGPIGLVAESFKGVGISGTWISRRGWSLDYDGFVGGIEPEARELPTVSPDDAPEDTEAVSTKVNDVIGARITASSPVDGLKFLVSAYAGDKMAAGRQTASAVGAEYLANGWSARCEYARLDVHETRRVSAGYIEVARMLSDHWQVAVLYDKLHESQSEVGVALSPELLQHKERALSLNYWFSPGLVLKLAWHLVDGNRIAAPLGEAPLDAPESDPLSSRTRLLQFGAQFSF